MARGARAGRAIGLGVAVCLVSAAVGGAALAPAASATGFELSGKPIAVGTPQAVGNIATAVDGTGTAYVAWSNTRGVAGVSNANIVQYCVIPPGATGCSHSGDLVPADGALYIDRVQVLLAGSTDRDPRPRGRRPGHLGARLRASAGVAVDRRRCDLGACRRRPGGVRRDPQRRHPTPRRGDRPGHGRARLRLGHRAGTADVQRVPAERPDRVLEVPMQRDRDSGGRALPVRDPRAADQPRPRRQQRRRARRTGGSRPGRDARDEHGVQKRPVRLPRRGRARIRVRRRQPESDQQL